MAKNISRTVSIYINGKEVEASLKQIRAEVKKLENEQAKLPIGTEEYIKKTSELARLKGILNQQREAVNGLNSAWDTASVKLNNFANIIQSVQAIMAMGDSAIGSLKDLVADAASLDDAYADVMKTTGLTHDQVQNLNEAFKKMDTRTSREQLNQLAYEAGKLGINTEESVAQFVSAADKINIALGDVLGEGAMVTIGKVADVFSKSTDELRKKDLEGQMLAIGSAINSLGQASTANEAYMVDFLSRMGGVATQAGISADQILAFASALDQANMPVEMSATALQRLVGQMIQKPEEFIKAADMSMSEFKDMLENDMYGAITKVLSGMERMGGFTQLLPMFSDMGLDGQRAASVVASLAGSLDKVAEAQAIAADELKTGNSVMNEFATKNTSMAAEAEKAKKRFEDMRLELGEKLYPVIVHLTRASTTALKGLSGYLNLWKENRVAAVALSSAMVTLVAMLTKSYIIKAKERAIDAVRAIQMRTMSAITAQAAASEAKHAAAREASRLATLKQQLAIEQKIIADNIENKSMSANMVVMAAEVNSRRLVAQITQQQTIASTASAAAAKAQRAAFAATPWGAIITLVASLAAGIAVLVGKQREFRNEVKELNKEIGNETSAANYLFDKLETLDTKTSEYKDTLSQLNDLYPDILKKYSDEEGHLINLADARQAVIDKIKQQVIEQRKLDKYGSIAGDFSAETEDALQKMHDYLVKDLGEKAGQMAYQALSARLPKNYDSDSNIADLWDIVKETTNIDLGDKFGWNKLVRAVGQYNNAIHNAYLEQQKWEEVFNDTNNAAQTWSTKHYKDGGIPLNGTETENTFNTVIPDPDKTKAKAHAEKWKTVLDATASLITDFANKSKSGAEQLFAEIEARSATMSARIESNTEASRQQKDQLLQQLAEATQAYKDSKLEDYINKISERIDGQLRSSTDNPLLNKVLDATRTLQLELAKIDAAIAQVNADLAVEGLSESQREQLQALINKYQSLRTQMTRTAYRGIDTSVDSQSFSLTGDSTVDYKAYDELINRIDRAKAATLQLADVATDPAVRSEYLAQAVALDSERLRLIELMENYDKFAAKVNQKNTFKNLTDSIDFFANQATKIFSSICDRLDNIADQELQDAEKLKEQNIKTLNDQLEAGYLSQQQYNEKKEALEKEYDAKSEQLAIEKWKRDKALSITEASIAGALAIMRVWSEKGNGTTAMRVVQSALVAATMAAQIAAITATPKPYAKGGYVPERTYFMAGESGAEWVASNRLLADKSTAPIISALERYQRGDSSALGSISMDHVSAATTEAIERARVEQAAFSAAMLQEIHQLNTYLSDPMNRQAYISRQTQERFDRNESFLRQQARL